MRTWQQVDTQKLFLFTPWLKISINIAQNNRGAIVHHLHQVLYLLTCLLCFVLQVKNILLFHHNHLFFTLSGFVVTFGVFTLSIPGEGTITCSFVIVQLSCPQRTILRSISMKLFWVSAMNDRFWHFPFSKHFISSKTSLVWTVLYVFPFQQERPDMARGFPCCTSPKGRVK